MINIGIFDNDILIVDRAGNPKNHSVVVASLDGELVIKRLSKNKSGHYILKSENSDYPDIKLKSDNNTVIWGVATYVIHKII